MLCWEIASLFSLHYPVVKIYGLENLGLWQRLWYICVPVKTAVLVWYLQVWVEGMKVEKGSQGEGGAPGNQDEKDKEKVPAPGPGSVDKVGPSPERILGAVGYHGLLLNCKEKIENN